jgi:CSLREA domain-containing protein
MAQLVLNLLGTFQAILDERPVTTFEYDKVRALLAYLAVESDRPHRREKLAGMLWPGRPERAARRNLSQALHHLRRAIGDLEAERPFLIVTSHAVQFDRSSDYWLDGEVFAGALEQGGMGELAEGVAAYRGRFLSGFSLGDSPAFEEWSLVRREQLRRQALGALDRLVAYHEERGERERALNFAWRQVELEPCWERGQRAVMRLLAVSGRRSAALAQYEACRRALAEELGVDPEKETRRLHRRILTEVEAEASQSIGPGPPTPAPDRESVVSAPQERPPAVLPAPRDGVRKRRPLRPATIAPAFVLLLALGVVGVLVVRSRSGEGNRPTGATPRLSAVDSRSTEMGVTEEATGGPLPARGMTITVNTTEDELNNDGDCSLREAIEAANTDAAVDACTGGSGVDTVILPAGTYTLTVHGADEDENQTGDLDIRDDLTLRGEGTAATIIDGDAADRVIHVLGTTFAMEQVSVTNGRVVGAAGGAVLNWCGRVTIDDCTITGNTAGNGGGLYNHAGVRDTGTMEVIHSQILNNTADSALGWLGNGGGIANAAAADRSTAVLTVTQSVVAGNLADGAAVSKWGGVGGAIISGPATMTLGGCPASCTATVSIRESTVSGNTASGEGSFMGSGGGIIIVGGTATVVNTTISGNAATGEGPDGSGLGGGIATYGLNGPTEVKILNSTVGENRAAAGGGGVANVELASDPTMTRLQNTIIADNRAPTTPGCANQGGTLTSLGHNLEDGDTCNLVQSTDWPDTDPMLQPLAHNGGWTETHALPVNSPAVDRGSCRDGTMTDQRGAPRPVDAPRVPGADDGCDIGAYEMQFITVNAIEDELNNDGDCSLREAIEAANTDAAVDACPAGSGADIVMLPAGTYTLTLHGADEDGNQTGDLDVLDDLTLQGGGAMTTIIDGDAADRVMDVLTTTLEISDITLTNGWATPDLGPQNGGGLRNRNGSVRVANCVIRANVGVHGGGLANMANGAGTAVMVVSNTLVLSNTADDYLGGKGTGGGLYSRAKDHGTAILTVTQSVVRGNTAHSSGGSWGRGNGGGVGSGVTCGAGACDARLAVVDSTVSGNTAFGQGGDMIGNGGGLLITGGTAKLVNSTVSGNRAAGTGVNCGLGGGIAVISHYVPVTVELVNCTVSNNTAAAHGGGVASVIRHFPPTTIFRNTIIAGNGAPLAANCHNDGGMLSSLGYNLEDGDTCNLSQPTDLVNTDPLLEPLANNGGPTETHALPEASPAADQGSCPGANVDQRGMPRPADLPGVPNADDGCDIGAYELHPEAARAPAPVICTGTGDGWPLFGRRGMVSAF